MGVRCLAFLALLLALPSAALAGEWRLYVPPPPNTPDPPPFSTSVWQVYQTYDSEHWCKQQPFDLHMSLWRSNQDLSMRMLDGVCYTAAQAAAEEHLAAAQARVKADEALAVSEVTAGVTADNSGDYATAERLFRKWAERGDIYGQHNLGVLYANGRGVIEDDAEAVRWWRKAADRGHADALNALAWAHYKGEGVAKDFVEAARLWRIGAEQGHADSQFHYAFLHYDGEGVAKDFVAAAHWWRKAAEQGHARAQFDLGLLYMDGEGVPKDEAEGRRWLQKSADQGYEPAKKRLAQ